jgi:anaerobic magnesium-protoporphyrin IX monomethyl ester cyclase
MIAFVRPAAPLNRYIQNVPLNYIHLAAYLRTREFTPVIFDMVFDEVTEERVDREIRERGIRIVGIGCMTCEFPQAVEQARRLKTVHPGLKIVFGGAHPSGDPEGCLATGAVDYVIAGEGELALAELLEHLSGSKRASAIRGLWHIDGGKVVEGGSAEVPDVLQLPAPAYDLLDLEKYFRLDSPWHFPRSNRAVQMITERGCPYQCSYCHEIHTKRFRALPRDAVVNQMEWLINSYGVREFMIVDDIFNFDLERAKAICREIVRRNLRVHLQFPNGLRGDRLDEELIECMRAAGTHFIAIAFETVSQKFQKLVRKHLDVTKARQAMVWAQQRGIEVSGFFMIGFPGETLEEARQTLDFAVAGPFDSIFVSIVTPFKGTRLRSDIAAGRFGEARVGGLDSLFPVIENPALPEAVLIRLQREAYWRFYTRFRIVCRLAVRMANARNVAKVVRAILERTVRRRSRLN